MKTKHVLWGLLVSQRLVSFLDLHNGSSCLLFLVFKSNRNFFLSSFYTFKLCLDQIWRKLTQKVKHICLGIFYLQGNVCP